MHAGSLFVALAAVASGCGADVLNDAALHAHVDDQLARDPADAVPAAPLGYAITALVPGVGSYRIDHRVFGRLRPSAIALDWILGGLVPACLVAASFFAGGSSAAAMRWTALGVYAATRVGVIVIGTLHIDEYDRYLAHQRAAPAVPGASATIRF
jgi:hypothetical protein